MFTILWPQLLNSQWHFRRLGYRIFTSCLRLPGTFETHFSDFLSVLYSYQTSNYVLDSRLLESSGRSLYSYMFLHTIQCIESLQNKRRSWFMKCHCCGGVTFKTCISHLSKALSTNVLQYLNLKLWRGSRDFRLSVTALSRLKQFRATSQYIKNIKQ